MQQDKAEGTMSYAFVYLPVHRMSFNELVMKETRMTEVRYGKKKEKETRYQAPGTLDKEHTLYDAQVPLPFTMPWAAQGCG